VGAGKVDSAAAAEAGGGAEGIRAGVEVEGRPRRNRERAGVGAVALKAQRSAEHLDLAGVVEGHAAGDGGDAGAGPFLERAGVVERSRRAESVEHGVIGRGLKLTAVVEHRAIA